MNTHPIQKMKYRRILTLIILMALFAAPGYFAWFFYKHQNWISAQKTNKGELLSEAILFPLIKPSQKWHLILWQPYTCDKDCVDQIDKLARVRLVLGRHLYKLEVWLTLGFGASPLPVILEKNLKDIDVYSAKLLDPHLKNTLLSAQPKVYLANPEGFIVLAYEPKAQSKDIFHDLKRVLNVNEQ